MPDTRREFRRLQRFFVVVVAVLVALALIFLLTREPPVERSAPTEPAADTR